MIQVFRVIAQANGGMAKRVAGKIDYGWMKWRKFIQVMCDEKKVQPMRLKGKFYNIVWPAMIYGSEYGG